MQIGMVGLGKMGANMTRRLLQAGHGVVAFDLSQAAVEEVVSAGARPARSLDELVELVEAPRAVWVMVPAGPPTAATIVELSRRLSPGDVVIDGGNSRYTDTLARSAILSEKGITLVDVGTSGGVWGLAEGYCLMVGADRATFERLEPLFASLAPAEGYAHVGPSGAGHFVKMVHNGIEYGLMQAYAEGFELMSAARDFDVDVGAVAELWRHGSVVRSWLLDLAARALRDDAALDQVTGYVEDSGEGRWMVETAVQHAVPLPAITASLFARFSSRQEDSYAAKLLAALRREFGGHAVREVEK